MTFIATMNEVRGNKVVQYLRTKWAHFQRGTTSIYTVRLTNNYDERGQRDMRFATSGKIKRIPEDEQCAYVCGRAGNNLFPVQVRWGKGEECLNETACLRGVREKEGRSDR